MLATQNLNMLHSLGQQGLGTPNTNCSVQGPIQHSNVPPLMLVTSQTNQPLSMLAPQNFDLMHVPQAMGTPNTTGSVQFPRQNSNDAPLILDTSVASQPTLRKLAPQNFDSMQSQCQQGVGTPNTAGSVQVPGQQSNDHPLAPISSQEQPSPETKICKNPQIQSTDGVQVSPPSVSLQGKN